MADLWYYTCEGKQMEPVTERELKQLASSGNLKPTDLVWREGMPKWIRAGSARELFPEAPQSAEPLLVEILAETEPAKRRTAPKENEDRPRRRRQSREDEEDDDFQWHRPRRGLGTGAKVAIILGVLASLGLIVAVILVIVLSGGGGGVRTVPFDDNSQLTWSDPLDQGRGMGCRCKTYQVRLRAGMTYTIDLESADFDAYLSLEDERGIRLSENDDRAPFDLNARIVYRPLRTGTYKVIATSLVPGIGRFHLSVR